MQDKKDHQLDSGLQARREEVKIDFKKQVKSLEEQQHKSYEQAYDSMFKEQDDLDCSDEGSFDPAEMMKFEEEKEPLLGQKR